MAYKTTALSSVVKVVESGGRPKGGSITEGIPSLGAEHLNNSGSYDFSNLKYIPQEFYAKLSKGKIQDEDILIVKDGATTGKISFVDKDFPYSEAAINEHLFRIRVNEELVHPKFLFYYLSSKEGKNEILKDFRGATVGGITKKFADIVQIPLLPLAAQKKIVNVLDEIRRLIENRRKQIIRIQDLKQSTLLNLIGDPEQNPKGWERITISNLTDKVKKLKRETAQLIRYIDISSIDNVQCKIMDYTEHNLLTAPSRAQQIVQKGDILISTVRPNLKNIAVVNDDFNNLIASTGFCVLRPQSHLIKNHYLFEYIKTEFFTRQLSNLTVGANYPAVKNSDIFYQMILLPPMHVQDNFARLVERCDKQKDDLEKGLKKLERLFQNALQPVFWERFLLRDGFKPTNP